MEAVPQPSGFRRDAWISAALAFGAAVAFLVRWWLTGRVPSLLAGLGFAALTRIWFIAPIDFKTYARSFKQPVFAKLRIEHPHRKFSSYEGVLVLVGWSLLLASVITWALDLFR